MLGDYLPVVAASAAAHVVLYFLAFHALGGWLWGTAYTSLRASTRRRISERLATSLTAVVLTVGSSLALAEYFPPAGHLLSLDRWLHAIGAQCPAQDTGRYFLAIAVGCWGGDLALYCTVTTHHVPIDYVHHACSVLQAGLILHTGWFCLMPVLFLTNEVSTPLLHAAWIGKHLAWRPAVRFYLHAAFALLFLLSRVAMDSAFALMAYRAWFSSTWRPAEAPAWAGWVTIAMMSVFMLVQYYWFAKIVQIARAKATTPSGPRRPTARRGSTPHRRRIINPALLAEYAYVLRPGGVIYTITDVEDLYQWMSTCLSEHPLFERVADEELADDPVADLVRNVSEEAKKVEKNRGSKYLAVFRRVAAAQQP
eukprot:m51a1_g11370 putative trna (guanine-n -)-methyltransferase (367) ;mRNA; f:6461-13045